MIIKYGQRGWKKKIKNQGAVIIIMDRMRAAGSLIAACLAERHTRVVYYIAANIAPPGKQEKKNKVYEQYNIINNIKSDFEKEKKKN